MRASTSPLFPDLPTLTEVSGEDHPPTWFGLFAPTGTPKKVADPAWKQKNFIDRAIEPAVGGTGEFARFIVASRKRAAEIANEAGIQPQ